MREEIVHRTLSAIPAKEALRRHVLSNEQLPLQVCRAALGTDVLSRAMFNCQCWTYMNRQETKLLES
eukprot:10798416-Lingulodinium_polyedra.AAC.1